MKKYAIAENRWAYAGWCGRNGVKQDHAVYVREPERLTGLTLAPEQVILIDGWEKNPRATELRAAVSASLYRSYRAAV